jgi:hypothetical protein
VSQDSQGQTEALPLEATEDAERRGLALTMPAALDVSMVGDTGLRPTRVTSWPLRIARRTDWLAAAESRSA